MCVYLYIHNTYIQYTHIYYVNKNFCFGCNLSYDVFFYTRLRYLKSVFTERVKATAANL